jgi:hypothetical protein
MDHRRRRGSEYASSYYGGGGGEIMYGGQEFGYVNQPQSPRYEESNKASWYYDER